MNIYFNPQPKPNHPKSDKPPKLNHKRSDKPKKVTHNRKSPRLRDRGLVKPEVYIIAYERSRGRCERCKWKDGSIDPTGARWKLEAAHAIRRRHLDETTPEDLIMLCGLQANTGTCHNWVDMTREGMEWAKQFRINLLREKDVG